MKFREQAERFGAEFVTADADKVDLTPGAPFGVWVGEREFRAQSMIITTGASARMLGPPRRAAPARPRRLHLRHLRRLLLPGEADRGRRRRRLRDRGGDLPHQVRHDGHRRAPARRAAGLEDHAGPRARQPEDRVQVELRGERRRRQRARSRPSACATRSPAPNPTSRCRACSSRSVTTRTPRCSPASSTSTRTATSSPRPTPRAPRSRACSPPATCRTTSSARPSPQPDPGCMAAIEAERWLGEHAHAATDAGDRDRTPQPVENRPHPRRCWSPRANCSTPLWRRCTSRSGR